MEALLDYSPKRKASHFCKAFQYLILTAKLCAI